MKAETYNKNYNKLLKYAESSAISVIYAQRNASAQWQKNTKTITLSPDHYNKPEELAFFLHELGHVRDDYTLGEDKELNKAYIEFNKLIDETSKMVSKKHKLMVIDTEFRAWNYGIATAKQLGIRLGKWYYHEMDEGLKTYFEYAYPKSYEKKYKEYRRVYG